MEKINIPVKLIKFDYKNLNGRIYSSLDFKTNSLEKINETGLYGEIGYPISPIVDLSKVTHKITNFRIEDNW
jgi:hypothetical protein